jgi:hypothetical protein
MLQTEKSLQANIADDIAAEQTPPVPAANPAPDADFDAVTQPAADPAATIPETAAAAVIEALRMMGLAAPTGATPPRGAPASAAPPSRSGPPPAA